MNKNAIGKQKRGADFRELVYCILENKNAGKRGSNFGDLDVRGDLDFCCMVKTLKKYKPFLKTRKFDEK